MARTAVAPAVPLGALTQLGARIGATCAASGSERLTELGADPFAALRVLPVDVRAVWRARAAWAVVFTLALVAGHAVLAPHCSPARRSCRLRVRRRWPRHHLPHAGAGGP
mgnify:CR=1 FL=1